MNRCLAFVLGGGGARGALQVGALRALFEAGYTPDLLVGTSIGAINATGLALWGIDLHGIEGLEQAYQEVVEENLMDSRLERVAFNALSGRPNHHATRRFVEFLISKGITPDFRFDQLANIRLALIGADLNSGQRVIYGQDPGQSIMEGLLASTALHPWFAPVEKDSQFIVDGGAVSNLPIEPALAMGATEIIALDLSIPASLSGNAHAPNQYVEKLLSAVGQREIWLEFALAEASGVPVKCMHLRSSPPVKVWDFSTHRNLAEIGYEIASQEIASWANHSQSEYARPALIAE